MEATFGLLEKRSERVDIEAMSIEVASHLVTEGWFTSRSFLRRIGRQMMRWCFALTGRFYIRWARTRRERRTIRSDDQTQTFGVRIVHVAN